MGPDWGVPAVDEARLLREFYELVKIDSETGNERAMADYLKTQLRALHLDVEEDASAKETGHTAGNLLVNVPGVKDSPCILFMAHMDTVKPGRGIVPRREGDVITSDGTTVLGSDDKAGLAAILEGVRQLLEKGMPHYNLQLVFTVGEESGMKGSSSLQSSSLKAAWGYAFDCEGAVGEVITKAPAQAIMNCVIRGRAAHAGIQPEKGISAIQVASKAIANMPLGRIDRETTANVGRFAGGEATNVVCDYVEIQAEARSLDVEKLEQQVKVMQEAFAKAAEEYGATTDIEVNRVYGAYQFSESEAVVRHAQKAIAKIGRAPLSVSSGGGSDANVLSSLHGIPTVNLAVGYDKIHTTEECISITELKKSAELVTALASFL